jgi:hypothetical protein
LTSIQIGLAVGEVLPLMNRAKEAQIAMKFELISDYEILRLQFQLFIGKRYSYLANRSELYGFRDMFKIGFSEKLKNETMEFFTHTTYINEEIFESVIETKEKSEKEIKLLFEIKDELKNPNQPNKTKQLSHNKPITSHHTKY